MIGDRAAALLQVDRAIIHDRLARQARLARTRVVGAEPRGEAQRILRYAEVLVEPVPRHRRGGDHAAIFVVLPLHLVGKAILPRRGAETGRPCVGVALALQADQDRRRGMGMRLGITPRLVLADPQVEAVARHMRLHAAVAGGAAIVERQFRADHVRHEVRALHRKAAHRIRLDVVARLEIVFRARIAIREIIRRVEDEVRVVDEVHDVGRRRAAQEDRRCIRGIHEAMIGVERNREERALLPFERGLLRLAFLPDFRRAAPFDDHHDLFVEMPFDLERAARRHLDDIHAPQAFGAIKLDLGAASAKPLPRGEGQVEHGPAADAAVAGNAFRFHELVIGHGRPLELAEAGILAGLRFVPMLAFVVMRHVFFLPC